MIFLFLAFAHLLKGLASIQLCRTQPLPLLVLAYYIIFTSKFCQVFFCFFNFSLILPMPLCLSNYSFSLDYLGVFAFWDSLWLLASLQSPFLVCIPISMLGPKQPLKNANLIIHLPSTTAPPKHWIKSKIMDMELALCPVSSCFAPVPSAQENHGSHQMWHTWLTSHLSSYLKHFDRYLLYLGCPLPKEGPPWHLV